MTTILDFWKRQSQTMKCRTDDTILENILHQLDWLTPSERHHLSDELAWIWLEKDYPKIRGE